MNTMDQEERLEQAIKQEFAKRTTEPSRDFTAHLMARLPTPVADVHPTVRMFPVWVLPALCAIISIVVAFIPRATPSHTLPEWRAINAFLLSDATLLSLFAILLIASLLLFEERVWSRAK